MNLPAVLSCLVVCSVGLALRLPRLDGYANHDEGVYAQTLLLMARGSPLYSEIFHNQGPLFLTLVFPFWATLGESIPAARLGVALISMVGVAGAWWAGHQLGGTLGGYLAGLAFATSPLSVAQARNLQAEGPAVAFAVLAVAATLAYSRGRGRASLVLGALTLGVSLAIKPLVLGAAVSVIALILVRGKSTWRSRWMAAVGSLTISAVVLLASAAPFGLVRVAETLILYRISPPWLSDILYGVDSGRTSMRAAVPMDLGSNWLTLGRGFQEDGLGIVALGIAGLLVLATRRPAKALSLIAWPAVGLVVLLVHSPLLDRHALSLIAPLAMVSGGLIPRVAMLKMGPAPIRFATVISMTLGAAIYVAGLPFQAEKLAEELNPSRAGGPLLEAAKLVENIVEPHELVFTDHNFAAVLAHRMVPPPLADLDDYRVRSGWITERDVIEAVERYGVRAVVIWQPGVSYYDRLLPAALDWIRAYYQPIWVGENSEVVAVRRDETLDFSDLPQHRLVDNGDFESKFALRAVQFDRQVTRGRRLNVRLVWQRGNVEKAEGRIVLLSGRVSDPVRQSAAESSFPLGSGWSGSAAWQVGDLSPQLHRLTIPETLAPGEYRLYAGLIDPETRPLRTNATGEETWEEMVELGVVNVIG